MLFRSPTPIIVAHNMIACAPEYPPNIGTSSVNPAPVRATYQGEDFFAPINSPSAPVATKAETKWYIAQMTPTAMMQAFITVNTCAMPLADDELLPDRGFVTMEPKTSCRTDIDLSVPLFAALVMLAIDSVVCAITAFDARQINRRPTNEVVRFAVLFMTITGKGMG